MADPSEWMANNAAPAQELANYEYLGEDRAADPVIQPDYAATNV